MTDVSRKEYHRQYRKDNKQRLRWQEHVRAIEWRKKLLNIVGSGKCKDCGNEDYRVLQFDHIEDKVCNVAHYINKNWEKALAEAKKCEVVCANCHTIRTYERRYRPPEVESTWVRYSKEVCPQGHPRTEENRYIWKNRSYCRLCRTEAARKYRKQKRVL